MESAEFERRAPSADRRGSALLERQHRLRVLWTDVVGPRPDEAIVRVLFEAVRRPAGDAAHREDWREQIDRNAERVVDRRRIEVDVRVELLLRLDERFDALRHLEPACVSRLRSELLGHAAQVRGARVLRRVYAMAESGYLHLLRQP